MPMPYSVKALKRLAGLNKNGGERGGRRGGPGLIGRSPAMSPTPDYFFLSVAQPPLPLQEFLPLQPLSPVLQPPLPLQLFWPLQACFSFTFLSALASSCAEALARFLACTVAAVPERR